MLETKENSRILVTLTLTVEVSKKLRTAALNQRISLEDIVNEILTLVIRDFKSDGVMRATIIELLKERDNPANDKWNPNNQYSFGIERVTNDRIKQLAIVPAYSVADALSVLLVEFAT